MKGQGPLSHCGGDEFCEFWTEAERASWPQAITKAARRKQYGISLHAPFNDKHPALAHMTSEERQRFGLACKTFAERRLGEALGIIEQIVNAVIERLPEKEVANG